MNIRWVMSETDLRSDVTKNQTDWPYAELHTYILYLISYFALLCIHIIFNFDNKLGTRPGLALVHYRK